MLSQQELFLKCPYATAQKLLSGKWTLIILHHLDENKIMRFNELKRCFPEVTQATLTKQLRFLEQNGLINRKIYPEVPPKVEYSLTKIGSEFSSVLESIEKWGYKYIEYNKSIER